VLHSWRKFRYAKTVTFMKRFHSLAMLMMGMAVSGWGIPLTLDWVSPGDNPVGYVYVSPYTAEVQGTNQLITLYCIDFNHEVAPPLEWQANLQTLDQANVPNMQYASTTNAWAGYEAAAWLIDQLAGTSNLEQQAVYQYAAWMIFLDPAHTAFYDASVAASGLSGFGNAIDTAYNQAITAVNNGYTPTGFDVLTPTPAGTPDSTQEFLVFDPNPDSASSPEPSSIVLLATVLASCGFYVKRRANAKKACV
jgi:hypothetical protein